MTQKRNSKPYFVFGCICLAVIFLTLIINKNLTPDQRFFFKILFALGLAGVAAVIPGILSLKYNNTLISAGGAIVVFLIVLKINPPQTKFDLTIFPKNSENSGLVSLEGKIKIQLESGFADSKKVSDGTFKVTDIPNDYFGKPIRFYIEDTPKWVFTNDSSSIEIKIEDEQINLVVKPNKQFFQVAGLLYYKGSPLKKVKIMDTRDESNFSSTNNSGYFVLKFNITDNRSEITLRADTLNLTPFTIKMGNTAYEWSY